MNVTRRSAVRGLLAGAGATIGPKLALALSGPRDSMQAASNGSVRWNADWDRALLTGVVAHVDKTYDAEVQMCRSYRGPEYNYQSKLRGMTVHPIRDAFEAALALLEEGSAARVSQACVILDRTLRLQEVDPESKWFGLWSYYLEEPLAKMSTVDFNWADFNGATLLMVMFRHRSKLSTPLQKRTKEAVGRAAASIRRRDISPYYTNIAAQGSFVVFGAAELLADEDLLAYAVRRMRRWAGNVDECGSFSEYNSPAYSPLTIENMTRLRTYVKHPEARLLGERLHRRAWQQLATHWHAPTMQLAGPMARSYTNDIGAPLWLQKGTGNRISFQTKATLAEQGGPISAVVLDYECPADLVASFERLSGARMQREEFVAGGVLLDTLEPHVPSGPLAPVQGSTMLTPAYALGSANRSDFWVQRRPLLAFWGSPERPPHWMQLRVVKSDYDFSSAMFYSVQDEGAVLGAVGFRNDGGDKHPIIERIQHGAFPMRQIYAAFDFGPWQESWTMLADGRPVTQAQVNMPLNSRISIDTGSCRIGLQFHAATFAIAAEGWGAYPPTLQWKREAGHATLRLTLYRRDEEATLHWADVRDAGCVFTCWFSDAPLSLDAFDAQYKTGSLVSTPSGDQVYYTWRLNASGRRDLALTVRRGVGSFDQMERGYAGLIAGRPVAMTRLSEERILRGTAADTKETEPH